MRFFLAFLLLAAPALAASWAPYVNDRYGFTIDIPPGFVNDVPAPDADDGLTYHSLDGKAELAVWGNNLAGETFKEDTLGRIMSEKENQWLITYERAANAELSKPGGGWYVYSGTKEGRIMYAKSLAACRGEEALHFRIEYPEDRKGEYASVVSRLAVALKPVPGRACPES
jgi:hypothetical protein